ncbi:MAG: hypothetical protein FWD34_06065 [Oscillospiraceae bacterium]|nr:hypothetical protein [Oscillospiraceae bacterium]
MKKFFVVNEKMRKAVKIIWIAAVVFNLASILFFYYGFSTPLFNPVYGTSWGYYILFIGWSEVYLAVISIVCLIFKLIPRTLPFQILLILIIALVSLVTLEGYSMVFSEAGIFYS